MVKQDVLRDFLAQAQERVARAHTEMANLKVAMEAETKSSAGDKYETAREMISQSIRIQSELLAQANQQIQWLEPWLTQPPRRVVGTGALVRTTLGWFLVGPISGEVQRDGQTVRALTPSSPLAQAIKGLEVESRWEWKGTRESVQSVE